MKGGKWKIGGGAVGLELIPGVGTLPIRWLAFMWALYRTNNPKGGTSLGLGGRAKRFVRGYLDFKRSTSRSSS